MYFSYPLASSDYKQSVALPEASMATVSTQKTDKCLLASTFSYVAPEPSFFTETHIAFLYKFQRNHIHQTI